MSTRRAKEFAKATKRNALKRSLIGEKHICEAAGASYGLPPDTRCTNDLARGVEFHHAVEAETGGDASLENCRAICIKCHRHVTRRFIRELRHSDRVRDRDQGIAKPRSRLAKRPPGTRYDWRRGGRLVRITETEEAENG